MSRSCGGCPRRDAYPGPVVALRRCSTLAKAGPDFYGALASALQCITEVIGSFWAPCQPASGLLGDHFRSLARHRGRLEPERT